MTARRVFTMRLKPGALAEYRRLHAQVWPELEQVIRAAGVVEMRIYERDPLLVVVSECSRSDAWDVIWNSEVHSRWDELMHPLLDYGDDGKIDSAEMHEVYAL
jgi:L-rhamnose mutarotase